MLSENVILSPQEIECIRTRNHQSQLAFAILLKYYQQTYEFLEDLTVIPKNIINKIAHQLKVQPKLYIPSSRSFDTFYSVIRNFFKTSFSKSEHYQSLQSWIKETLLPNTFLTKDKIHERAYSYLKEIGVESFKDKTITRIINAAVYDYEVEFNQRIYKSLSYESIGYINGLLLTYKDKEISGLGWINKDITNPALLPMLNLLDQLEHIESLNINYEHIKPIPKLKLFHEADAFTRLNPSDLKAKDDMSRCADIAKYCYIRRQQITDRVIDMFNRLSHNIVFKSEKRVVRKIIQQIQKVYGKGKILFSIAEACLADPDQTIREQIFPIADQKKLQKIIDEYQKKGEAYQTTVHNSIKNSYSNHYRRMIGPILKLITFHSNNKEHQPVIKGIEIIKKYYDSGKQYIPDDEDTPINIIPPKWHSRIIEESNGKIKRISYEVYLLKVLGNKIKCREVWIENSIKHANPDLDLPGDFDENKDKYHQAISQPLDADQFINLLKQKMRESLSKLNNDIPRNNKVAISSQDSGQIKLTPLEPQVESENVQLIKKHLHDKWQTINLIDILKEVELNTGFTKDFVSYGEKIYLKPDELSEKILLAIYGFGTNVGLKHVRAGNPHIKYSQLRHVKDYFISKSNLKNSLTSLANELFSMRDPNIWGEMPVAVACDSTQFSAYFQNLISEYHNRYGGRGVMIYWHVEKKAVCVHAQLKSVSTSEVPAMISGVLNHCTEMSVGKSYVDTHGQSEVGFAFSYLLGFNLMPRLANIKKQRLYQCDAGDYHKYNNLQSIMSDTINWQLIKEQYSQMVKYTAAMKEGYAEPEAILRRFTRNNLKHPTYLALSQLGKAVKTIFLCEYLMYEKIRREIQEGLNVVELWNGVSKFIFYGRTGEISSNHEKSQELSVLSLQFLQLSMIYINTLMIQQIIREKNLLPILTQEDKRALTPLIYEHVNPYGLFPLDLNTRLPNLNYKVAA